MIELGKRNILRVVKITDFGVYLNKENEPDTSKVLLPKKEVAKNVKLGDEYNVFIYKDSDDRPIATTAAPKLEINGLSVLDVISIDKIGAFLNWVDKLFTKIYKYL